MYTRQRVWFICALSFIVLSLALGGWGLSRFLAIQRIETRHTLQDPTRVTSATATARPSPDTAPLDMARAHLVIPAIKVNAPVELVGVLPTGNLGVPTKNQWDGVGWYQKGPLPGQPGSSVIDGHLDKPGGLPAVFWNLRLLHPGDIVTVVDNNRRSRNFRVMKMENYTPDQAPLDEIFGNKNGTFLNLITCAGSWIPQQHQTTLRLVVYTKLIA